MSAADPLAGMMADDVEDLAARLAAVLVAVTDFGRPDHEADQQTHERFELAFVRALIASLAAWIAHDHQDEEQHASVLESVIIKLRAEVAAVQAQS